MSWEFQGRIIMKQTLLYERRLIAHILVC